MAVLIATDGSEHSQRAVEAGLALAADLGEPAVLVTAYRELDGLAGRLAFPDAAEIEREWAERTLAEVPGTSERIAVHGEPADAILRLLRERDDVRLVVVGSRGLGGLGGTLLGSVSRRLVDESPCPVLVVPTSKAASTPHGSEPDRSS